MTAPPTLHWSLYIPRPSDPGCWPWWECLFGGARVTVRAFTPDHARDLASRRLGCGPRQVAIEAVRCVPTHRRRRPKQGGKLKAETRGQLSFTIIQDDSEEPES